MKNLIVLLSIVSIGGLGCIQSEHPPKIDKELGDYVDPFIGTSRGGNQQPGARMPFGMTHFSPVNNMEHSPKSSNYIYGETDIFGFSLVNISGVGCPNYGGILIMPTMGEIDLSNKKSEYIDEKSEPGYYSVNLNNHSIKVELTATKRCGYARFTYPEGKAGILLDLSRRHSEDSGFYLEKISNTEFAGHKQDGTFCGVKGTHTTYFYSVIKQNTTHSGLIDRNEIVKSDINEISGEDLALFAQFDSKDGDQFEIISGISYVSIANAKENLMAEIGEASFEEIRQAARKEWEEKLSRIAVEGGADEDKTKFYTAIYHTMSHPNIINDVNGEYPAMTTFKTMKMEEGKNRYSLYSLWDTYRTLHPFLSLVYPEIQSEMVQSMVDMYNEGGWLPHWELISNEKGVMNGDPAPIVIADSYLRGIRDFDINTAYEAMLNNAENSWFAPNRDNSSAETVRNGIKVYLENGGYITQDYKNVWGCVATTMEYNLSDWNIAMMAKDLGKNEDYEKFLKRSEGYRYFWDEETQFFRPRFADGSFLTPFDETEISGENSWAGSGGPGYCEGNAWHYLYFVPHDIQHLIDKTMGENLFVDKLQVLFDSSHYEATNEPDIAFPFLFNYVKGEEWRTQKTVRELVGTEFGIKPDGIPGNDDAGTMSAWLIFAMMGIYPDCPGSMVYQITTPVFDKISIALNPNYYSGKEFVLESKNSATENQYIANMKLNGIDHYSYTIKHEDIVKGGSLIFELKGF